MNSINHDDLIKLNERLDTILSSDKALEAAAKSKSSVFRAAAELTRAEHPAPTDAMRERMRAKMLQAVPVAPSLAKKPVLRPNFMGLAAKVAAVVLVFLFVGLLSQFALANSLPGDIFYSAKRGFETVELVFAGDALAVVNVHLAQSERRLDESERMLAKGQFDTKVMEDALTSLESAIRIANDNNLFEQDAALEARSQSIFSDFTETLEVAEAANLVPQTELLRLEASEELVMGALPSLMADPSSSSEVTTELEASPTVEIEPTEVPSEVSPEETEPPLEILDNTVVYVNAEGSVNVREGAGTAYPVIAQLNSGISVTAIGAAGDWTQVQLADGRTGFIANFLLSETEPTPVPEEIVATEETGAATDTGTSGGTTGTTGASDTPSCERGRSCDSPGHSNGNNNGNGGRGN